MSNFLILLVLVLYNAFIFSGCAYIVFWKGHSGWWFIPAFIAANISVSSRNEETEEDSG